MIKAGWLYPHKDDLSGVYAVREAVFTKEQGFPAEIDHDEYDATAAHVYVQDEDGRTVATGRLFQTPGGAWRAGRFAVLKQSRGQQLGDMVMRMILYKAEQLGVEELLVDAQVHAVGFYKKFGFEPCGEDYLEYGCPHTPMKVRIDQVNWHKACAKHGS